MTAPPGPPITTRARLNVTRPPVEDSRLSRRCAQHSPSDRVQRVKIGTLTRRSGPLVGAFDSRTLAPLVERCDELPTGSRSHHLVDVLGPPIHITAEKRSRCGWPVWLGRRSEARRDAERSGRRSKAVNFAGRLRRRVLVPAIRLT